KASTEKEGTPDVVADSEPEKIKEKDVSSDNDESRENSIGRRLRSRTTEPAPPAKETPVVTKKVKGSSLKPVKYGAKKSWSKIVPPSEKKKNVLKRKSAPSSDSDF
ncbi:hypothetical protein A2U01_0057816, partial [Trifolium medium]|nr:hypothetical protein [Trifolium medium]